MRLILQKRVQAFLPDSRHAYSLISVIAAPKLLFFDRRSGLRNKLNCKADKRLEKCDVNIAPV